MKACRKCKYIVDEEKEKSNRRLELKAQGLDDKEIREKLKEMDSNQYFNNCPICNSTDFSSDFSGRAIVVDPENSEVAEQMNITKPGVYALRVR